VARHISFPSSLKQVQETIEFCQNEKIPCALLGAGSNSVYSDDYFNGVILSFEKLNF
jgi:UDP-N-acetylmuramate dehydrogenase